MSFNITFLVQMLAFALFVIICMKYIWPALNTYIEKRQKEIADSLAQAQSAKQEVDLAHSNASKIVSSAHDEAKKIVDDAHKRKSKIIDEAGLEAKQEKERIVKSADVEIDNNRNKAREELRKEIASLAIQGAEKIVETKSNNATADAAIVDQMLKNL